MTAWGGSTVLASNQGLYVPKEWPLGRRTPHQVGIASELSTMVFAHKRSRIWRTPLFSQVKVCMEFHRLYLYYHCPAFWEGVLGDAN